MTKLFVAASLGACVALAHAQAVEDQSFLWQSRNANYTDLSAEFGRLYGALYDASQHGAAVEVYQYKNDTRKPLRAILEEEKLLDGKYLPKEVDIYLCSLNPTVCTLRDSRKSGVKPTAVWRNKPDDPLLLPKISFEKIIVHQDYVKKPKDSLESIVVNDRKGCVQFDEACKVYLNNLNRRAGKGLGNSYGGEILVPTLSYRASITLKDEPSTAVPTPQEPKVKTPLATEFIRKYPGVGSNVIPRTQLKLDAAPVAGASGAEEGTRQRVMSLISHPFASNAKLPVAPQPRTIGVFDTWMDRTHCDLSAAILEYKDSGEPVAIPTASTCGALGQVIPATDHGTHVVGLLAASRNGKSGPGMNPDAKIYFVRINPDSIRSTNASYLAAISAKLDAIYQTAAPDVINLSFEYPFGSSSGTNDTLLQSIKKLRKSTLFVASAGNSKQKIDAGDVCGVRPACFGDINVITVGAVDLSKDNPQLTDLGDSGSNYGSAVHIVAPGVNIVSTISGNRMGAMSGTSQAAPLVAGAASILSAKEPHLYPWQIRNRLIYTSDLFPALYPKVFGGRLNISRALSFNEAEVRFKGNAKHIRGDLMSSETLLHFQEATSANSRPTSVPFGNVRRLKFERSLNQYVMYTRGAKDGSLERKFVILAKPEQTYNFLTSTETPELKKTESVRIGDIFDYVSAVMVSAE